MKKMKSTKRAKKLRLCILVKCPLFYFKNRILVGPRVNTKNMSYISQKNA